MSTKEEQFHIAIRNKDLQQVESLLKKGIDINCIYYGMTPLLVAITKGHDDIAVWLIDNGADVRKMDQHLAEAITKDQVQVVRHLAKKGVDLNQLLKSGHTPLTYAAEKNLNYMTQTLCKGGADVNLLDAKHVSPLYISSHLGHTGIVEQLLKTGSHVDDPWKQNGQTALISSVANEHLATVKLLIKAGCNMNIKDDGGWTALWHAVSCSNEDLVRMLVSGGADPLITDEDRRIVLQEAEENEEDEIADILRRRR